MILIFACHMYLLNNTGLLYGRNWFASRPCQKIKLFFHLVRENAKLLYKYSFELYGTGPDSLQSWAGYLEQGGEIR